METDLYIWQPPEAAGLAFTDDDSQAVVATYPTQEDTANRFYIPFDKDDEEGIVIEGIMPEGYDANQDLKLDIYFWAAATSGSVDFQAAVEAITPGDTLDLDAGSSFDSANSGVATVPATAGYPGVVTVTMTKKDSIAAGDYFRIRIHRDADDGTNDTAEGDGNVFGLRLYQETP